MKFLFSCFALLGLFLGGCSLAPGANPAQTAGTPGQISTPGATLSTSGALPASAASTALPSSSPPAAPTAPASAAANAGTKTLRIWVPPQFDPAAQTPAGELLRNRLDEFAKRRPGVTIDVRVKALDGPSGLLSALTAASAAAPLAMPDLIALPHDLMEMAALKGLLHPLDNLTKAMDDDDWYEYARQLAYLQDDIYGLPMAGDAQILVYRPKKLPSPPKNWQQAQELVLPLLFPAADPRATLTLAFYQASGGAVHDDEGKPFLDTQTLAEVFAFFAQSSENESLPYWLTQYQDDLQVWEAFANEQRSDLVVTWATRYLETVATQNITATQSFTTTQLAIAPLPMPDGKPFTLASGWVWALATPRQENQVLSTELAEFLTDSNFLAAWTQASHYLPPRPSALQAWQDQEGISVLDSIMRSAQLLPSEDIIAILGPPLQQAAIQMLKEQGDPLTTAQQAAGSLNKP